MRIFVTGATGFLGRAFCDSAIARGHKVLALCRSDGAGLPNDCEVTCGSLAQINWADVDRFQPDTALHLAWIATPGVYLTSPENEALVVQTEQFFTELVARGVGRIAGTGTCIEYAPSISPLDESSSPLEPSFPYSKAKVETANRLRTLAESAGTAWTWFRVFYPYGEGEHSGRMPTSLMRSLMSGDSVQLKTPDSVKDYIHVNDAAAAMVAALHHHLQGAVNIGTGEGIQIMELARKIAACCDVPPDRVKRAEATVSDPNPITIADVRKLQATGWAPTISLPEGLKRLRQSLFT